MKLWSDYEGRTIAEAYPLKKLVRPEGRSAFFLTTNGTGTPALVRVIEAHFDESEILSRWKTISEIGQENLIVMRKFGETELDGTPLLYAVMEPTEISLEELLENRTLTVEETGQLARSLVAALQALHGRGMVHGHIVPANILAAGETVKLRSDCVREAVSDPDGEGPTVAELKTQDAHAVAVVLLQALTGRTSLQGSTTLLAPPFDGIIRNGLSGRWGLAEMSAALGPVAPKQAAAATKPAAQAGTAATAKPPVTTESTAKAAATSEETASPKAEAAAPEKTQATIPATAIPATAATQAQESLFAATTAKASAPKATPGAASVSSTSPKAVAESLAGAKRSVSPYEAPDVRHRIVREVEADPRRTRMWIVVAAVVLVLLFLGWRMMRSEPAAKANGVAKPISTLGGAAAGRPVATAIAPAAGKPSATRHESGEGSTVQPAQPAAAAPAAVASRTPAPVIAGGSGAKTQWRVVAYTYNHEDQAQQKAGAIQKQHPSLNAEVFSPSGRAPYLVTVGGPMSRDQAQAFKQKARSEGLPHDIYTQNYSR